MKNTHWPGRKGLDNWTMARNNIDFGQQQKQQQQQQQQEKKIRKSNQNIRKIML